MKHSYLDEIIDFRVEPIHDFAKNKNQGLNHSAQFFVVGLDATEEEPSSLQVIGHLQKCRYDAGDRLL